MQQGSGKLLGICLEQMQGATLDSVLIRATESAMRGAVVMQMLREVRHASATSCLQRGQQVETCCSAGV